MLITAVRVASAGDVVCCALAAHPDASTFCCALGILACLDGYMNIAMEQTEEYVNGELTQKYGDCFIRGNNGACV